MSLLHVVTALLLLFFAPGAAAAAAAAAGKPNFFLVMCDDMDKVLGGEHAIPQVNRLLAGGGANAANYFVSSPKCTPSRSAWLSGRHYHNLRPHGATTGKGLNTSNLFDEDAVWPTLRRAGYTTGIFGKIHNNQGSWLCSPNNHSEPFDHIETECSPCGGYYRTGTDDWVVKEEHDSPHVFQTLDPADPFSLYSEVGGGAGDLDRTDTPAADSHRRCAARMDGLQAQYGNRTIRWLKKIAAAKQLPFFAFIGTSGPHLGVVPAPWHRRKTMELGLHGAIDGSERGVHRLRGL
jgi:arylsulfatase A-like enzyme